MTASRIIACIAVLGFVVSALGQQFPPWALGGGGSDSFDNHPALASVGTPWKASISGKTKQLRYLGTHIAFYNAAYGELAYAIRATGGGVDLGGSIGTGLTYILHAVPVPSPTGGVQGLLLTGVNGASKAEVKFLSWDGNTAPQASQMQSLVVAATTTDRYLAAGIVDACLYIFDGVSTEIREFVDGNADGLPETQSTRIPVALSGTTFDPGPVFGFFKAPNDEIGLAFGGKYSPLHFNHYVIERSPTALFVSKRENSWPTQASKPNIVGNTLVSGQEVIRAVAAFDTRVAAYEVDVVTGVETQISGEYTVGSLGGHVDIVVAPPLSVGKSVIIKSWSVSDLSTYSSDVFGVGLGQLLIFDGDPEHVLSGQQVQLRGANFSPTTSLTVKVDGQVTPVFSVRVNSHTYIFVAPTVSTGDRAIRLEATLNNGQAQATKKMWISG